MSEERYKRRVWQLVRRMSAVPDPGVLERLALEVLKERPTELLADFLSTIGRMARAAEVRPLYMAIVRACLDGEALPREVAAELYSRVAERGEGALVRFLLPVPAIRTMSGRSEEHDPELEDMPLGTRKWKARLQDRDLLLRLARDGDDAVMVILLDNPRVREEDVVLWAARRPVRRAALMAIARHKRWSLRARVQEALARNPYTPVHVAASYMPVFPDQLLRLIDRDASLHELVRSAAREVLSLRKE